MTLSVNTNVPSLITRQHIAKSRQEMNQAIERLSSGLRINSAKDDATGLAMSDRMTSQIRGLNEAIKNSNDGISLVQTTEGALQETTMLLQRMRVLAIQSANATNSLLDRDSIQKEVISIKNEIDRIATATSFNGTNVLDGSFGTKGFHVGDQASQIITVETGDARGSSLGAYRSYLAGNIETAATVAAAKTATNWQGDDLTINNEEKTTYTLFDANTSAKQAAAAINQKTTSTVVTARAETLVEITGIENGAHTFEMSNGTATVSLSANILNNDLSEMVLAINGKTSSTGISAWLNEDKNGILLNDKDGDTITLLRTGSSTDTWQAKILGDNASTPDTLTNEIGSPGYAAASFRGHIVLESKNKFSVDDDTGAGLDINVAKANLSQVSTIDMRTSSGSQDAISVIDMSLAKISSIRSKLGASQNRFTSVITNLNNITENVSASRSRILDTDYAAESSVLTKNQIIQNAGLSMLSQTYKLAQSALSLLE